MKLRLLLKPLLATVLDGQSVQIADSIKAWIIIEWGDALNVVDRILVTTSTKVKSGTLLDTRASYLTFCQRRGSFGDTFICVVLSRC